MMRKYPSFSLMLRLILGVGVCLLLTSAAHPQPDGEEWMPETNNLRGDWRSQRPDSPWSSLPPLQAAPGVTALAGQVLTLSGQPLAKVTLQIKDRTAQTDNTGRFLLSALKPGHHVLKVDGRSASKPGKTYGVFKIGVNVTKGQTNVLSYTIWMPKIDTAHAVSIPSPTTSAVAVTTPRIPGLEVRIPSGTIIRDIDGQTVRELSITAIPVDRPPFPLPGGLHVPVYFTVQPGGAYVLPPRTQIIYPNHTDEPAGARVDFWNYDPEGKGWYVYGQGTVTTDRKQIVPDPGVVIYEFTGVMVVPPSLAPPVGPKLGNKAHDGEPVDLGTGLFIYEKTDLILSDILPITLTRTYRQNDTLSRPFGIGTTHPYEIFLVGDSRPWTYVELVLPDGGRVRYNRISPGTQYWDAVYEHTSTPTHFYKSRVSWNGRGYDLRLKDGTVYVFPDAFGRTTQREGALIGIRDRYGNALTLSRDTSRNLRWITSPNGRWLAFTYDASNLITQAQDNIGRLVRYEYDASGRLWRVTDPNNGVTEYTYDSAHQMRTVKDARDIVYLTNDYDANGRVIRQTLADGTAFEFDYLVETGRVVRTDITDRRGYVRRVTFDAQGYTLTDTQALGQPEERTITYERQLGTNFIRRVIDALGRKTDYTYDPRGNVERIKRLAETPNAVTSWFTYEPNFNRLASATDPLGHTTYLRYDARGNLTTITNPLGYQTTVEYNAVGQPISITDPVSNTTRLEYEFGDLVEVIDPLGNVSRRFTDGAGRLISLTDPLGHTTRYEYDLLDRLRRIIDPLQGVTRFEYDPNNNLLSVWDARDSLTSYTLDNMDRVERRTDPLLRSERYQYDPAGNFSRLTDRKGQVTTFRYDPLNRLIFVGYGTTGEGESETYESTTTYTYDAANRVEQIVDSVSGEITRSYDDLDRLISEVTPEGTITYTYDNAGRRESMTVAGQPTTYYTYDDADRLIQIEQDPAVVTFDYDGADRLISLSLLDGIVVEYDHDRASRITGIKYSYGPIVLGDLAYEYDAAGNRTKVDGTFARTGLPDAVASATYNAANQLTRWGTRNFAYDFNGNFTSDGLNTYTWNVRNQLAAITGSISANFQYDALGRRRGKTITGLTTQYLYDGINPVQELVGGAPTANLITGLGVDEIFVRTDSAGERIFLRDALGSTLALADSSGTVQTQYTYEPFGRTNVAGSASTNSYQYTSREKDTTELYYYRMRFHMPQLGRFLSEDDISKATGRNLYAYVDNNPLRFTDPLGLFKCDRPLELPHCRCEGKVQYKQCLAYDTIGSNYWEPVRNCILFACGVVPLGAVLIFQYWFPLAYYPSCMVGCLVGGLADWKGPVRRICINWKCLPCNMM